jgi:hypothetical protein
MPEEPSVNGADAGSGPAPLQLNGADRVGRFCALSHQRPQWRDTATFIAEAQEELRDTARHLREVACRCGEEEKRLLSDLVAQIDQQTQSLPGSLPERLPFLPIGRSETEHRPRVLVLMREWLLMAPHAHHEAHLQEFLSAYQELFPLHLAETRSFAGALRLALAERCRFLPSAHVEGHHHLDLIPNLIRRIFHHLEFVEQTDWKAIGETVSRVHSLLSRDPAGTYPRMDFLSRDAYRNAVEELSHASGTSESSVASRALALAERNRDLRRSPSGHVGYYLFGCGRKLLTGNLRATGGPAPTSSHGKTEGADDRRSLLRLDFTSGIPGEERVVFVLSAHLTERTPTARILDQLQEAVEACHGHSDLRLGVLLQMERGSRGSSDALRKIIAGTGEIGLRSGEPLALFLQQSRILLPPARPIHANDALLIPFSEVRHPGSLRRLAGFWCHPLNAVHIAQARRGSIRTIPLRSLENASYGGTR